MEEVRERNLRLKRMISTEAGDGSDGSYPIPSLFAVRVSVCQELREELKMNGREKRGRAFIELGSDGTKTLKVRVSQALTTVDLLSSSILQIYLPVKS